jgi:hypothetical protein
MCLRRKERILLSGLKVHCLEMLQTLRDVAEVPAVPENGAGPMGNLKDKGSTSMG